MRVVLVAMTGMGNAALAALRRAGIDVPAVVTDAVAGGRFPHYPCPDLIADAQDAGAAVWTGLDLRSPEAIARVLAVKPDVLVVATSPKIVGMPLVDALGGRAINCHPSLLPRHRGPTPIPWTIASGDTETGISFIRPTADLDAGPVWHVRRTTVGKHETAGELRRRLDQIELPAALPAVVEGVATGRLTPRTQRGTSTYERHFGRALSRLDFRGTLAADCIRRFRAVTPHPGLGVQVGGEWLRLTSMDVSQDAALLPGEVGGNADGTCLIGAADAVLRGTYITSGVSVEVLSGEGGS